MPYYSRDRVPPGPRVLFREIIQGDPQIPDDGREVRAGGHKGMKTSFWLGLLFLLPIALALFWLAAPFDGAFGWMPRQANTAYGDGVDKLHRGLMIAAGAVLGLTQLLLVLFLFCFRARRGRRARYSHGSTAVQMIWVILVSGLVIAVIVAQTGVWAKVRNVPADTDAPDLETIQVFAEQFQWNFRHRKRGQEFGSTKNVAVRGTLTLPANRRIVLHISSKDVIHGLFLPHFRVRQDAIPGRRTTVWFETDRIPVWNLARQEPEFLTRDQFRARKVATNWEPEPAFVFRNEIVHRKSLRRFWYHVEAGRKVEIWEAGRPEVRNADEADCVLHFLDLTCAELCGNNHFSMTGRVVVLPDDLYEIWLDRQGRSPVNDLFEQIWDTHFAHYNQ